MKHGEHGAVIANDHRSLSFHGDRGGQQVKSLPGKRERLACGALTERILAGAIDVHREMGPGLLESAYRTCLIHRFTQDGLSAEQEVPISMAYADTMISTAYRADIIVENAVLIELKAVEQLLPIHQAQVLTYLKLCNLRVGLLINFNVTNLMRGVRRFVR